jgi:hypothetical protein
MSLFARGGLVLFPSTSLVENAGVDATGTHGSGNKAFQRNVVDNDLGVGMPWPMSIDVDNAIFDRVKALLQGQRPSLRYLATRMLRRILPKSN